MSNRFMKFVSATAIGAVTISMSSEAQAFFPPIVDPPQTVVVTPPVVNPILPQVPVVPPVVPPPPPLVVVVPPVPANPIRPELPPSICPIPKPPPPRPHCDPCHGSNHCAVPEPTTILSGLFGLSVVGIGAIRKRLSRKGDQAAS